MSTRNLPPSPTGVDLYTWATQIYQYLQDRASVMQENLPRPVLLLHQTADSLARATTAGVLMYDPVSKEPVYSSDGQWVGLSHSTFLELTDTPLSYTGEAGKVVSVTGAEDGLEFVAGASVVFPPGGDTDSILKKASASNFDVKWENKVDAGEF